MKPTLFGLGLIGLLALQACGTAISTQEDAAKAAYLANAAGSAATASAGSPLLFQPVDGTTLTATGKTGTASVKMLVDVSGGNVDASYEITFNGYSADGKNTFDGTMTQTVSVSTSNEGFGTSVHQKGKITISGEYDSTMDMDVTTSVKIAGTIPTDGSLPAGGVSVKINGFITADGTKHEFNNEVIAIKQ